MNTAFFFTTAIFYTLATLVYIIYLMTHRKGALWAGKNLLFAGFIVHILTIASRFFEAGHTPVTNLHESLSFFSFLIVLLFFIFQKQYKIEVLGSFVAPFCLILLISATFLPKEIVPLSPILKSMWLPVHITLAFLGNAFFALATCVGVMYLIQERYIKNKKLGGLYFVLPSLEILDELNYKCLTYGFPLLTLGMITGSIWAEYAWGSYWSWDPRQTWSLITWFLYAALLHGRLTIGWRGKKAAVYVIAAFTILLSSFLTISLLSLGSHAF